MIVGLSSSRAMTSVPFPPFVAVNLSLLACVLTLSGCGGADAEPQPSSRPGIVPAAAPADPGRVTVTLPRAGTGDPTQPRPRWQELAGARTLAAPSADPQAGLRATGPTARCREAFVAPADLVHREPAALPPTGAALHHAAERAAWRQRLATGPFLEDGDHRPGSPGDAARLRRHAERFEREGDPLPGLPDDGARSRHGHLARDAAFLHLLEPKPARIASVTRWLLEMAAHPANDFAGALCYVDAQGQSRDGFFAEAPWLLRWLATLDAVRPELAAADRVTLENYARRQAWFFATHLDLQLRELFPQRLQGRYDVVASSAAATGDAIWWSRRVDTNGDCKVDEADAPTSWPQHTHVGADGVPGPRVAWLALWFNNRRAAHALVAALAGVMLDDPDLAERGKRYVMEWLAWGVYPDGSMAETARNGEYCVARQGLVYGAMNVQPALLVARVLARQGDTSLVEFHTRAGRFGSESGEGQVPKSLALATLALLRASDGTLGWHRHEPWKTRQEPRSDTALGTPRIRYLGTADMVSFHELGLLAGATAVPAVPVAGRLLDHPLLGRPPSADTAVVTGLGEWSDALGMMPAVYLLRPLDASSVVR